MKRPATESNKRGRPRKEPEIPAKKIGELAGIGCTDQEIAHLCGFSVDTLTRNFAELLDKGRADRKRKLRKMMWDSAEAGNVTMQIWLSKNELAMREPHEISSPGGGGILQLITNATLPDP